jgi:hypothetical protein
VLRFIAIIRSSSNGVSRGKVSMRGGTAALVVAFVVLSALVDRGAANQRVITGTVTAFQPGEWISLANDQTDPEGLRFAVRETTVYEWRDPEPSPDPTAIKPGVRVTVSYASNVADRVRVAQRVRAH